MAIGVNLYIRRQDSDFLCLLTNCCFLPPITSNKIAERV